MTTRDSSSSLHAPTGTPGLDQVLSGGVPGGKPTLLTGDSGTGKTLFALAFAAAGLTHDEPVVFASFEERADMLARHAAFLGVDLEQAIRDERFRLLDMRPGFEEATAEGELELTPVRARMDNALSEIGARRLVLDSLDSLFVAFTNSASLRRELLRLLEWIRDSGITTLLTAHTHAGDASDRMGLSRYIVDCVIELSRRTDDSIMTRYLQVIKYRGSPHGSNLYPFVIDQEGIFVLPVTGLRLDAQISGGTVSTGLADLDGALAGQGIPSASVLQISGRSGTGKSVLAASVARAACESGLRVLYVSFEESSPELIRNQQSVGNDLSRFTAEDPGDGPARLVLEPIRAVELSLEGHLLNLLRLVDRVQPDVFILDPVTSLREQGSLSATKSTILRLVHHLKDAGITVVFAELLPDDSGDASVMNISSMVDTWIRLRLLENNGELNRLLHIAKSRGRNASNQVYEFHITPAGMAIEPPYIGPGEMVVGTAKKMREQVEARQRGHTEQRLEQLRRQLALRERMTALKRELDEATQQSELSRVQQEIDSLEQELMGGTDSDDIARARRRQSSQS